jgi:hypothetical protein
MALVLVLYLDEGNHGLYVRALSEYINEPAKEDITDVEIHDLNPGNIW